MPEAGDSAGSPTVRRRELGSLLRALRNERGLTVEQVAAELLCSPSKVSRMETGHRGATARDIRDLCRIYGVTDSAQQAHLTRLAAEGKQQGWWRSFELDYFATFVGLEEAATATKNFQSTAVPGLLQIPDYARAMYKTNVPEMPAERIDQLIQVRLTRQRSLVKKLPLQLSSILDEAVLRRLVGGYRVMRDQVRHLANAAQRPNVTIQIIPFSAGAHPAMESTFDILEFDGMTPSVVYVEGLAGNMYLERLPDLQRYEQVFDHLHHLALSPQDSIELLAETAEQYDRAAVPAEHHPGNVE